MGRQKVRCGDCGAVWTEIYPEDNPTESYSSIDDPKPCDCQSQYIWITEYVECSSCIKLKEKNKKLREENKKLREKAKHWRKELDSWR